MNVSVYAHITKATEISVGMHEGEVGKYAVFRAGYLSVLINSREKMLEIASLLESAAQKWEEVDHEHGEYQTQS